MVEKINIKIFLLVLMKKNLVKINTFFLISISFHLSILNPEYLKQIICGKGDLNSRTPMRMDSKSTAYSQQSMKSNITFDHTWQFPHVTDNLNSD